MTITISCPKCKVTLQADDSKAGLVASCPKCKSKIRCPTANVPNNPSSQVTKPHLRPNEGPDGRRPTPDIDSLRQTKPRPDPTLKRSKSKSNAPTKADSTQPRGAKSLFQGWVAFYSISGLLLTSVLGVSFAAMLERSIITWPDALSFAPANSQTRLDESGEPGIGDIEKSVAGVEEAPHVAPATAQMQIGNLGNAEAKPNEEEELPIDTPDIIVEAPVEPEDVEDLDGLDPAAKWKVDQKVSVLLKVPHWYEVRGVLRTLNEDGTAVLDIPNESGQTNRLTLPPASIFFICRLEETEHIRTEYSKLNEKLQGKSVYRIQYYDDGSFLGAAKHFRKELFNLTGHSIASMEIDELLATWRALGDEDVLHLDYTWSEDWAIRKLDEHSKNHNVLQRAGMWLGDRSDAQLESMAKATITGIKIGLAISEKMKEFEDNDPPSDFDTGSSEQHTSEQDSSSLVNAKEILSGTISGQILLPNGKPVGKGVIVRLYYTDPITAWMGACKAWTDKQGRFSLTCGRGVDSELRVGKAHTVVWKGRSGEVSNFRIQLRE